MDLVHVVRGRRAVGVAQLLAAALHLPGGSLLRVVDQLRLGAEVTIYEERPAAGAGAQPVLDQFLSGQGELAEVTRAAAASGSTSAAQLSKPRVCAAR